MAGGALMTGLDGSIVNTVLPVIARGFDTDVAGIQWVVTSYLLALSGLLLSCGRLGDIRGHRAVYLWGFVLFVGSSAACALAPSLGVLIAARCAQGVGAALLSANSLAILTAGFPDQARGRALGTYVMLTYLGLVIGPSLGGWLADQLSWRAVFAINLPLGLGALILSYRSIPRDHASSEPEPFDLLGAGSFTLGFVLLLLGLNQAHAWGWTSLAVAVCFFVAAASFGVFVHTERTSRGPMLDLRLFHSRLFSAAVASAMLNYIGAFTVLFLLPFYLIQARGLNPSQAGLVLSAMPLVMVIVAPISGTLSDWIGSRLPATLGLGCQATGLFLLSRLSADSSLQAILAWLGLIGLGIGLFVSPNTSAALGEVPPQQRGVASGVLGTARNLGMVLGLGLAGAIYTSMLAHAGAAPSAALLTSAAAPGYAVAAGLALVGAATAAVRGPARL
jgi:EmrB/QacA subfamily drug resistance transporter